MTINLTPTEQETILQALKLAVFEADNHQEIAKAQVLIHKLGSDWSRVVALNGYQEKPDAFDESNDSKDYKGVS